MGAFDSTLPFTGPKQATTVDRLNSGKVAGVDLHDHYFGTAGFRGLRCRQKPGDTAKAIVTQLDEVVMHDGYRYSGAGWVGQECSLAAGGVGGISTFDGAVTINRWYELLAIAKSSDDTKALLFHLMKTYFADEIQQVSDNFWEINGGATPATRQKVAQGFQFDSSPGTIEFVDVLLQRIGTVGGYVQFTIEADNAGNPSGTPLQTSERIPVGLMTTAAAVWVRVPFRTPVALSALTQYHLVASVSTAGTATDYMQWKATSTVPYARGTTKTYNGAAWAAQAFDQCFRIWCTLGDAPITDANKTAYLPASYDRFCRLSMVFADPSGLVQPFTAQDRLIVPNGQLVITTASAVPDLVQLVSGCPPVPVSMGLAVGNDTATNAFQAVAPVPEGHQLSVSGNLRQGGASRGLTPVATPNPVAQVDDILTEFGGIYVATSGVGNGYFGITHWRW
jgi:hypothetical protein